MTMKAVAIVLIAIGLIGLTYGGVYWTGRERVFDVGSIEVTQQRQKSLPVPPIVGAVCLAAGLLRILRSRPAR